MRAEPVHLSFAILVAILAQNISDVYFFRDSVSLEFHSSGLGEQPHPILLSHISHWILTLLSCSSSTAQRHSLAPFGLGYLLKRRPSGAQLTQPLVCPEGTEWRWQGCGHQDGPCKPGNGVQILMDEGLENLSEWYRKATTPFGL